MKHIVIYGLGDFAQQMMRYFSGAGYQVIAFCADSGLVNESTFMGIPVVPFESVEVAFPPEKFKMFVAVGYSAMRARKVMYNRAVDKGYQFVNYISPTACIASNLELGGNNVILQGTQIEPSVIIGSNNIIWSSVNISHDVRIGDHCFLASQSLVGGKSVIKDGCFLGFNSTVIQGIEVEEESLIGAKSLVIKSTEKYSQNIGIPAKTIGYHEQEGIRIK